MQNIWKLGKKYLFHHAHSTRGSCKAHEEMKWKRMWMATNYLTSYLWWWRFKKKYVEFWCWYFEFFTSLNFKWRLGFWCWRIIHVGCNCWLIQRTRIFLRNILVRERKESDDSTLKHACHWHLLFSWFSIVFDCFLPLLVKIHNMQVPNIYSKIFSWAKISTQSSKTVKYQTIIFLPKAKS